MPEPFDVADLATIFKRAAERVLAVRDMFLDGLAGEPVHITPAAFRLRTAWLCSLHPLTGMTTHPQYARHNELHHPTDLDDCPHCGFDMTDELRRFDPFLSQALPDPVSVLIIEGVLTRDALWQGTVRFQWVNDVCPNCRKEIVR